MFRLLSIMLLLTVLLGACSPAAAPAPATLIPDTPAPTQPIAAEPTTAEQTAGESTAAPTATDAPPAVTPTPQPTAVAMTTHTDAESGFTFDYPADWMLDSIVLGSRAPAGYQLTSWSHDPGMVSEVPADGTIMNIAVQLWDPKGDLSAFVENRKTAWEASGIAILSEEEIVLGNGSPARAFTVQGSDQALGYFLFTILGENYLVASGNGDLESIALVSKSIR